MSQAIDPTDPGGTDKATAQSPERIREPRVRRRRRLVALGATLATVLVAVAIWQALATSPTADSNALTGPAGGGAPNFSLPSLADPSAALSPTRFRGRPLVVNFWASWCVPCRTEMPLLEAAFRSERGKVLFLGIDSNDTASAARTFLAKVHVTYPVVSDPSATIATSYGLFGLPTTVFISRGGKIVGRHIGELNPNTLRAALHEAYGV